MTARQLDLDTITLGEGSHSSPDAGLCLLEAVAYVAGETHTDHPACASPILGAFGRTLNDTLPNDKRQALRPFVRDIVGTAGDGHDQERGLIAADWLIRTYTPAWLRLAGLTAEAETLEQLPRQATWDDVAAAVPTVRAARQAAGDAAAAVPTVRAARQAAGDAARDAAWDAAGDAAWDAAGDAARDAAWDAARDAAGDAAAAAACAAAGDAAWAAAWAAARDAARDAAWDAAGDAAGDAAWDAARDAARDAAGDAAWDAAGDAAGDAARDVLQPAVDELQDLAIETFIRMVQVGR